MKTIGKIFLIVFALSTLGALVLFLSLQTSLSMSPPPTQSPGLAPTPPSTGNPSTVEPSVKNSSDINFTALIGSVITSVTSLVGFITTTVITWRKEKRESALADVERKKLELELEKDKLELNKMKKSRVKKKSGK